MVERSGIDSNTIDDVIAGCVAQVGDQSLNVARTAVLAAGFADTVPGTTIDRQCGSSQQAMHFAVQVVMAGSDDVVIVGGVESMSRIPLGSANRGGDSRAPLAERYPEGLVNQGVAAGLVARRWNISRTRMDAYDARSHELAAAATAYGVFDKEILRVTVTDDAGSPTVNCVDETVRASTSIERTFATGIAHGPLSATEIAERYTQDAVRLVSKTAAR